MAQILKVVRIGNSRGVRLPAALLARYRIKGTVRAELRPEGIVLKPGSDKRLSWEETFKETAAAGEEFSDLDGTVADGLDRLDA